MEFKFEFKITEDGLRNICLLIYFLGLTLAITYVYRLYF